MEKEAINATKATNITWHSSKISLEDRRKLLGHHNKVIWFTGLSASGKSTIACEVEKELHKREKHCYLLDGDNIRHGLNKNLGFSKEDREENIRRIAEVSKLFYDSGVFIITSFISPYASDRKIARELIGEDFIEVFVDCSLEECERRDPKGLYAKARAGEIKGFTGIDDLYEKPENPEIVVDSDKYSVEECVEKIVEYLSK